MLNQLCPRVSPRNGPLAIVLLAALLAPGQAVAQSVEDGDLQPLPAETELQPQHPEFSPMNNRRLGKLLKKHFPNLKVEGQLGIWRIELPEEKQSTDAAKKPTGEVLPEAESQPTDGSGPAAEANGKPAEQKAEPQEPDPENVGPGADEHVPPVLLVLTDERADRMRIMIAIRPFNPQLVEDLQLALIALHANYDRALDARYAIHDGVLWSAFIHPLSSLTPSDLTNALNQVQTLRETTGTTYSSGNLMFAAPVGEEKQPPAKKGQAPPQPKNLDDNVT